MAFSGLSTGVLISSTQGDSTSLVCIVDSVRYFSSTGGAGKKCVLKSKAPSGTVWFQGTSPASYGLAPATWQDGIAINGIVVASLPEGYVQISLR